MEDPLEILDSGAEVHPRPPSPVLVVLPDPEARAPVAATVLGRAPLERVADAARQSGFGDCLLGPGTTVRIPGAREVATSEWIEAPALVVFEGTLVHPQLFPLMVAHPLEGDERFTLYDALGRPAACFVGHMPRMPAVMPVTEELPWPEDLGPEDIVRVVYEEDIPRCEALVLRAYANVAEHRSWWREVVDAHTLRWLTRWNRPRAQLELLALVLVLGSVAVTVLGGGFARWIGAALLLLGVHVSRALPRVQVLCGGPVMVDPASDGDRLVPAIRPLGQAAYMGGLTYLLVAETDRSGVAALVLLAAGATAVLLTLVHARTVLRGRNASVFALPDAHSVAARLGVRWPQALDGAPFVELLTMVAALTGIAELPWLVLLATAAGRLWRWFSGPDDLFPSWTGGRSST